MRVDPRYRRHLRTLLRANPGKVANVLRVESEFRRGALHVAGRPYVCFVDVCNRCNLSCPLCPSALPLFGRPRGVMRLAEYERVLDRLAESALEINLHNWGEPFLNPDIFAIVEATRRRRIGTNLSSNLGAIAPESAEDIVRCGLEYLVVSLDGTTPDVYAEYRRGGDLSRVMTNLRALVDAKRRLRSALPVIEWQFLVMRHNEHQLVQAAELARGVGVDVFRPTAAGLPFAAFDDTELARRWMPADERFWDLNPLTLTAGSGRTAFRRGRCFYLYRSITVNPGGGVSPCCVVHDAATDFGNLFEEDLGEVFNGERYVAARGVFAGEPRETAGVPCGSCRVFERTRAAEEVRSSA